MKKKKSSNVKAPLGIITVSPKLAKGVTCNDEGQWEFLVLIERLEGLRVQHFIVDVNGFNLSEHSVKEEVDDSVLSETSSSVGTKKHATDRVSGMCNGGTEGVNVFDGCHMHIKQPVFQPGITPLNEYMQHLWKKKKDEDCCSHNRVLFRFRFDQQQNSAVCVRRRQERARDCELGILIGLVDPRYAVRGVRVSNCTGRNALRGSRPVEINNLCGMAYLPSPVVLESLAPVCKRKHGDFGCVAEIFSILSHTSIKPGYRTVLMKGVSNYSHARAELELLMQNGSAFAPLFVHLVVLTGCIGMHVDVSMGCYLEKCLHYRFKGILKVLSRLEDASNHVDLSGVFNSESAGLLEKMLGSGHDVASICDFIQEQVILSLTVTRFGEVTFRLSFSASVLYGSAQDAALKRLCGVYMHVLHMVLYGRDCWV